MKNKILVLFIFLGAVLIMMPSSVFAMNNKFLTLDTYYKYDKYHLVKPTKAQIKEVGSIEQFYRGAIIDDLDYIYNASKEKQYTPYISNLIEQRYEEITNYVVEAENFDEIVIDVYNFFGMLIPVYTDSFYETLYGFETLTLLDTSFVDEDTTFNEFRDYFLEQLGNAFNCNYSEYNYNDYYWNKIQGAKEESENTINEATDFTSLIDAIAMVRVNLMYYSNLNSFVSSLTESTCSEDDIFIEDDYFDPDDRFGVRTARVNAEYVELGLPVYTNYEVNVVKYSYAAYLNNYAERQLEYAGYDTSLIYEEYNDVYDQIEDSYNVSEIVTLSYNTVNSFVKRTGIEYKNYTIARQKKLSKALDELKEKYPGNTEYTDDSLYDINDILEAADSYIFGFMVEKDVEIPEDFIDNVEYELDNIPTYAEELKVEQTKYINKLKKFVNNKKYNQTKVVPIVNEGIKKINACKDIDEVEIIYDTYYKKALATINKYKITTSKTGYGTITPSKTITYGKSFTVTMTPKKGYKIKSVIVDGKKVKVTTKYTFKNVVKAHTIKVVFVKK